MKIKTYEVYDGKQKIFEGSEKDIASALSCSRCAISKAVHIGQKIRRRYTVIEHQVFNQEDMDYIETMLNLNDKTTFKGNPKRYVKPLKKKGITFTFTKSIYDNDYILERTN